MAAGVYQEAFDWTKNRGGTGSMNMQKALLHLYNDNFEFNLVYAIRSFDANAKSLYFACLNEYVRHGETEELQKVGSAIRASGQLEEFIDLCGVGKKAISDHERAKRKNAP